MKWIYFFAGVMMLIACGNKKVQETAVPVLEGEYQIVGVKGTELNDPELSMTFNIDEQRMNGFAGCNGFASTYEQVGNTVSFSQALSTKKYCEGKMEVEGRIHEVLPNITDIRVANGNVELHSGDEQALITLSKKE